MLWRRSKSATREQPPPPPSPPARPPSAEETAANNGTFPVIKSGPLYWARDKQAVVLQRAYAVLIPQRLLLYYREEDYATNSYNPQAALDLQKCLAVQRTKDGAKSPEFLLLLLPGGAKLFVCESFAEREQWINKINVAMEADIQTQQMQQILQAFSTKSGINFTFFHSLSLTDSSNYKLLDNRKSLQKRANSFEPRLIVPSSVPLKSSETLIVDSSQAPSTNLTVASTETTHSKSPPTIAATDTKLLASSEIVMDYQSENAKPRRDSSNPAPTEHHNTGDKPPPSHNPVNLPVTQDSGSLQDRKNPGRYSETFVSDRGAQETVDSGISSSESEKADGCSCLTTNHETDEVAKILEEVHPQLFNEPWSSDQKRCGGRSKSSVPVNKLDDKGEILGEINKLSMMLASQETACTILHESCSALKDTIGHLQRRMAGQECYKSASNQHWLPKNAQRRKSRESFESRLPESKQEPETAQDLQDSQRRRDQDFQTEPLYLCSSESALTTTLSMSAETLHSSVSAGGDSEATLVYGSNSRLQRGDGNEAPRLRAPRIHATQSEGRHSSASTSFLYGERPDILQEVTLYTSDSGAPAVCSCAHCIIPALSIILELSLPQSTTARTLAAERLPTTTARLRSLALHLFFHAHRLLTDIRVAQIGSSDSALTAAIADCVLTAIRQERVTGSLPPLREDERDSDASLKGLLHSATENLCTLIFNRNREPAVAERGSGDCVSSGDHNPEGAHLVQQHMKQVELVLPAYLVLCFIIYCLSSPRSSSSTDQQTDANSEDVFLQQHQYLYQILGVDSSSLSTKSIVDAFGAMSAGFLEQLVEDEASCAFSYELGREGSSNERSDIAGSANVEFTPLFMRLLASLKAEPAQNPANMSESWNSEPVQNLDTGLIHGTQNDSNVPTQAKETQQSGGSQHMRASSPPDRGDNTGVKPADASSLTKSLEHLESLSVSLLQQRKSLLERKRSRESDLMPTKSQDQDVEDYARAVAALRRQHEEEIKTIWDNVQANWVPKEEFEKFAAETEQQIHTLHQHLKRICADAQEKGGRGGLPSEDSAPGGDQGNPSLFILLRQLEKANEAFTSLLRSEAFREEFEPTGAGDRQAGGLADGMMSALGHLTSAAEYLRARLYGKDFEGIEEDEKELPSNYDCDDDVNGDKRDNVHTEWEPRHPTPLPYPVTLRQPRSHYLVFDEEEESEI